MPRFIEDAEGKRILEPGWVGAVLAGSGAALLPWLLYDPSAGLFDTSVNAKALGGALISGFAGFRLLDSYVERSLQNSSIAQAGNTVVITTDAMLESGKPSEGSEQPGGTDGDHNP